MHTALQLRELLVRMKISTLYSFFSNNTSTNSNNTTKDTDRYSDVNNLFLSNTDSTRHRLLCDLALHILHNVLSTRNVNITNVKTPRGVIEHLALPSFFVKFCGAGQHEKQKILQQVYLP